MHKVGLCLVLHDLTYVGDSYIFPGDGASHTKGNQKKWLYYVPIKIHNMLCCVEKVIIAI